MGRAVRCRFPAALRACGAGLVCIDDFFRFRRPGNGEIPGDRSDGGSNCQSAQNVCPPIGIETARPGGQPSPYAHRMTPARPSGQSLFAPRPFPAGRVVGPPFIAAVPDGSGRVRRWNWSRRPSGSVRDKRLPGRKVAVGRVRSGIVRPAPRNTEGCPVDGFSQGRRLDVRFAGALEGFRRPDCRLRNNGGQRRFLVGRLFARPDRGVAFGVGRFGCFILVGGSYRRNIVFVDDRYSQVWADIPVICGVAGDRRRIRGVCGARAGVVVDVMERGEPALGRAGGLAFPRVVARRPGRGGRQRAAASARAVRPPIRFLRTVGQVRRSTLALRGGILRRPGDADGTIVVSEYRRLNDEFGKIETAAGCFIQVSDFERHCILAHGKTEAGFGGTARTIRDDRCRLAPGRGIGSLYRIQRSRDVHSRRIAFRCGRIYRRTAVTALRIVPVCDCRRWAVAGKFGRACRFLRMRLRHGAARGQFPGRRRGRPQILDVPNPGLTPARPAEEASPRLRLCVLACRTPDRFDFPGFRLCLDSFRRPSLRARTVFVGEAVRIAGLYPVYRRKIPGTV